MRMKKIFLDGSAGLADRAEWPGKGEFIFACGARDGVLSRCSVERMDGGGASFFSQRKYAAGEEVGVQLSVGLGHNEFGTRVLNGRIKSCRPVRAPGGARLCRAEASWTSGLAAGACL